MKTPKDILFARHRPVETKLDAIRREVVATVRDQSAREAKQIAATDRRQNGVNWWRQLIWPGPRAWGALAAVWILIFALKLSTRDETHALARKSTVPPEAIAELRQQRLFFAELIGMRETRDAEPPKSFAPRPRSERRYEKTLV